MRSRWFISGWVVSKTTKDLLKVSWGSRGRVQDPHTFNIPKSHLKHCTIYNSYTDIQMHSVWKTLCITLKDYFLPHSIRILANFCPLKEPMPIPILSLRGLRPLHWPGSCITDHHNKVRSPVRPWGLLLGKTLNKAGAVVFSTFSFSFKTNLCSQVLEFNFVMFPRNCLFSFALPTYIWIENGECFLE